MATIKTLKLVSSAGDPDSVLARRIDVVASAQKWYDARQGDDWGAVATSEDKLVRAVERYRRALSDRKHAQGKQ